MNSILAVWNDCAPVDDVLRSDAYLARLQNPTAWTPASCRPSPTPFGRDQHHSDGRIHATLVLDCLRLSDAEAAAAGCD